MIGESRKSPALNFLTPAQSQKHSAGWTTEREQLNRLEAMKQAEGSTYTETVVTNEGKSAIRPKKTDGGTVVRKVIIEKSVKSPNPPNAEQVAVAQNLISSLQGRLASDQTANWQFNLGVTMSRAMSNVKNQTELQNSLNSLRQQLNSAPGDTAPEYLETVQKIITILEVPNPSDEERRQIGMLMPNLFRNK